MGDYHFTEKKLYAKHFEHADEKLPKIFISELLLEKFSPALNQTINRMINEIPNGKELEFDFISAGRPWSVSTKDYHDLLKESDYAAWVAAFGYRPNHFTVFTTVDPVDFSKVPGDAISMNSTVLTWFSIENFNPRDSDT
jgi:hypothetical protein